MQHLESSSRVPSLKEKKGLFGSCFLKLFLRAVFENTENIILMFFENCSYYLNLVFFIFFKTKKIVTKRVLPIPVFLVILVFENRK